MRKIYNDSKKIKKIKDDVIEKMGWEKLIKYNEFDEGKIQNLVRSTIRPSDTSETKIRDDVISELDRQFLTPLPKRKRK